MAFCKFSTSAMKYYKKFGKFARCSILHVCSNGSRQKKHIFYGPPCGTLFVIFFVAHIWVSFCRAGILGDNGGATNHLHHHRQCHQLQTALARVLNELERNPKKMMGTLVHVQLYTFSYRKPVTSKYAKNS